LHCLQNLAPPKIFRLLFGKCLMINYFINILNDQVLRIKSYRAVPWYCGFILLCTI
jgi:hypothetical protein